MSEEKTALRSKYSLIRKQVKSAVKDERIFEKICKLDFYNESDTVFAYYSVGSEADTLRIIESSLLYGKRVALPKCRDKKGNMDFYIIKNMDLCLIDGAFNLKEPDEAVCTKAEADENSVCFVPGLAFSCTGYRLGYGGGYYDRFLSNFKGITIGLTYDECLCEKLPYDGYDIKVDMIITDKQICKIK